MREIWKDIPGYEGKYQVSDLGNVRSLNYLKLGKIQNLKPNIVSGYYRVPLSKGKSKNYRIHQLVAITFLEHKPNGNTLVVDHINNNKLDNRVENLQILSERKNRIKSAKGQYGLGVSKQTRNGRFAANIYINGERKYLGDYDTPEQAQAVYQQELNKL